MAEGYCSKCSQVVDLVDYDMDPDDAQHEEDYYACAEHNGVDNQLCEGSGHSPSRMYRGEEEDNGNYLTMDDIDPDDFPDNEPSDWAS